jgi:hypothetical protein
MLLPRISYENCAERVASEQATTDQKYCASTERAKTEGAAFARQHENPTCAVASIKTCWPEDRNSISTSSLL